MKKLLDFIIAETGPIDRLIVFAGIVAGLAQGIAFFFMMKGMTENPSFSGVLAFLLAGILFMYAKKYALDRASETAGRVVSSLRKRILHHLMDMGLLANERVNRGNILNLISADAEIVSLAVNDLLAAASATAVLAFLFGYCLFLSVPGFLLAAAVLGIVFLCFYLWDASVKQLQTEARNYDARYANDVSAVFEGFKELKVDNRSAEHHQREASGNRRGSMRARLIADKTFNKIKILGSSYTLLCAGAIVFILPEWSPTGAAAAPAFVAVFLFSSTTIGEIFVAIPSVVRAQNAIAHILDLEASLIKKQGAAYETAAPDKELDWTRFELRDAVFRYPDGTEFESNFEVGPVNLTIERGNIIFIVGGNGSGKSTFLKLLLTLYDCESGEICLDDRPLEKSEITSFRNQFATVFTDFYLFPKVQISADCGFTPQQLLRMMELDKVTDIVDGVITNEKLSTGQRKRLALVARILEGKPILVLDEWAADQDPEFRRRFYHELLPELKANGRTIIAVSHDDRYFDAADQVYRMEDGKLSLLGTDPTPSHA